MSDVEKIGSAGIPLNIVDANGRKIMGDAYDNTTTYAVGDYCISGDHAYKCTTKIETPEDFNTNHWQQITIEEILKEHDASIELVNSSLTQLRNDIVSYDVYDILSEVRAVYTAIGSSSRIVMYRLGGNVRMIDFNIVASGGISSGKVTLTNYIASKNLVHGSIATSSGTSGFVQYDSNKDLFIRVPSAGTYNGQLVFIAP